jgi:hypothetical protein
MSLSITLQPPVNARLGLIRISAFATLALAGATQAFEGRAIVSISDGDMAATAYVDGRLGAARSTDALTVTFLDPERLATRSVSVPVSNSVAGPPTAIALSPDRRFAFVTESFAPRGEGAETFSDLEPGSKLALVDLSDLRQPRRVQELEVGRRPEGLSVHPDGDLVAVALHPVDGRQLALVPFVEGRLGTPQYLPVAGVEASERISHVEWHPSGRFLALTLVDRGIVMFMALERGPEGLALTPWGNRVLASKYPFKGRFTPDGRHFLTANLWWGSDVPGFWTEAVSGDVTSIRFADAADDGGAVRHFLVGKANVGKDPEGIAISPDGSLVASVNLETSYAPVGDSRRTPYSSVSLMRLDPSSGRLTHLDTVRYDGVLPEAATFDRSGRSLAVVTYAGIERRDGDGGFLDFFRVTSDDRLVKLRSSADLPAGPHSMQLVP